jgi:16S rRNA (guanine527-N7)-methyltransferase
VKAIRHYFPNLTEKQIGQFEALEALYRDWNGKINLISRKDIDNLYERHVLHALAIVKVISFREGTSVMDVGTGGGFPGIPLAIFFPETHFLLIDSVGKKIRAAQAIAEAVGLSNCAFRQIRVEEEKSKCHFVVSRAVMPLPDLVQLVRKNILREQHNALPNGIVCLKGGELQDEIKTYKRIASLYNISDFFKEDYFKTKKAVYMPL